MKVAPHKLPGDVESIDDSKANVDSTGDGRISVGSAEERPGIAKPHSLPYENHTPNGKSEISRSNLRVEYIDIV